MDSNPPSGLVSGEGSPLNVAEEINTTLEDIDLDDTDIEESLSALLVALLPEEELKEFVVEAKVDVEIEEQKDLIEKEKYNAAIIRQSSFIEHLLNKNLESKLEEVKGDDISNNEMRYIEDVGTTNKVRLANMLGVIEDENEQRIYSTLMSARNDLAHNWWIDISDEDRDRFERTSKEVLEQIENLTTESNT